MLAPLVLAYSAFLKAGNRWIWMAFYSLLAAGAAWALAEAMLDAVSTGTVSLTGSRIRPRPVVPWPHAWAYLLGLTLVAIAALASVVLSFASQWHRRHGFKAAGTVALGFVLFFIAPLLSSLFLTLSAISCLGLAFALVMTDGVFGRKAMWATSAFLFAAYCYSLYATTT